MQGGEWKKVVYGGAQHGFPDNYTHSSFLESMVMNASVVRRDFWATVIDSLAISQHLCVVALVSSVWTLALTNAMPPDRLLAIDASLLALGLLTMLLTSPTPLNLSRCVLNLAFFVSALYAMTSIFQTLTRSISSDSIWACTACLLLIHLFLRDYSSPHHRQQQQQMRIEEGDSGSSRSVAANVSLHASIVASVLIASRLPSQNLVFATMLFSLEFFLLFPYASSCLRAFSKSLDIAFSLLLAAAAISLLLRITGSAAVTAFAAALAFVSLACPYWLVTAQQYKFEINGPWDEAKLCFDIVD